MPKKYIYNPMTSINLRGMIFREYGFFTAKQIYNNVSDIEMESAYYFKMPKDAVIKEFKIITAGDDFKKSAIFSQTIEHAPARRLFDSAALRGDMGVMLQTLQNNAYKITIGRQLIAARTEIHITYYYQFDEVELKSTLEFPLAVQESDIPIGEEFQFEDEVDYMCELDLEIVDNANMARFYSDTHDITINEDGRYTTISFAAGTVKPTDDLVINIEYRKPSDKPLRYYRNDEGRFVQETRIGDTVNYHNSQMLDRLHYDKQIRKMEKYLHKLTPEQQIDAKAEILNLAMKYNILCSQTSLYAEIANERGENANIAAVHKMSVPILKKPHVFDLSPQDFADFARFLIASQRADGIIADVYDYDFASCANATALAIVALVSYSKKSAGDEKYSASFSEEFLDKSIDYLIKYLAESGAMSPEIKFCFNFLIDHFIISGERVTIMRKILENAQEIGNLDISSYSAVSENPSVYDFSHMVTILLKYSRVCKDDN
ncbi:MAG: hypothetical protein FWE04_07490 [Oscillospiraceae bacterium]|nr:hypothetical protein [Oscillospiraceae bacterium]